jgi:serine protease Do
MMCSSKLKKTFLFLFLFVATPACLLAKDETVAGQLSKEFRASAKKVRPAVVFIKAQMSSKKTATMGGGFGEEPMDPMQEELWKRFFGPYPFPQKPEGRAPSPTSQGSGFLISKDGQIITNNHVITNADHLTVTLNDGREFPAKVIGGDPNTDVALLKIEGDNFPFLTFADSDQVEEGDIVFAFGNPFGLKTSVTFGIISGKGRSELDIAPIEEFLQTDAALNRGNSGGPLSDASGNVIGLNTAIASTMGGGNIGIGFVIPSNLIKHVIGELQQHGKVVRGYLGVTLQKVEGDIAPAFGLETPRGALITDVIKEGPADKAGIKPGDIVLKINDKNIDTVGTLRNTISFMHPGDEAHLSLLRDGKEIKINVKVGSHPENEMLATEVQNSFGLVVQELTADLAEQLGYTGDKGVVIKYVAPNSVAHLAGLKRGQLILSINRKPVQTAEEFYSSIRDRKPGSQIVLHVKEGQTLRFVILRQE